MWETVDEQMEANDLFSNMPPFQAFRSPLSLTASRGKSARERSLILAFWHISTAHFHGRIDREYRESSVIDMKEMLCGKIEEELVWIARCNQHLARGPRQPLVGPWTSKWQENNEAVFVCPDDDSRTIDHGDDFAVFGDDESVNSFERMLKSYTFQRLAGLGFEEGDDKHGVFLNRATVGTKGQPRMVVYLHDSRHATLLIRVLELEKAPGAETPVAHCSSESKAETLNAELKCAMRAVDLVQDAPTISEAAKSLSRRMSAPSDANYQMFKREGTHHKNFPMTASTFSAESMFNKIRVLLHTDHATQARVDFTKNLRRNGDIIFSLRLRDVDDEEELHTTQRRMMMIIIRQRNQSTAAAHALNVHEIDDDEPHDADCEPEEDTTKISPQGTNGQERCNQDAGSNPVFDSVRQEQRATI